MRLLSILSNSKAYELLRTLQRDKSASTGLWLLIVFSIIVLFAPIIAPYGPNEAIPSLRLAPPGTPGHLLGLDHQGRDILSRIIHGTRLTVTVSYTHLTLPTSVTV